LCISGGFSCLSRPVLPVAQAWACPTPPPPTVTHWPLAQGTKPPHLPPMVACATHDP
jgi:hypothetical protein